MRTGSLLLRYAGSALLALGLGTIANAETAIEIDGSDVVAVGPIDLIETAHVTVLGRSYRIPNTEGLSTGGKVVVHGELQPDGTVKDAWVEPLGRYDAGSDPVYEMGVVSSVNDVFGRLAISGTEVDYTQTLSESGALGPKVGDTVAVAGIQPTIGGIVLGNTTSAGTTEISAALGTGFRIASTGGSNVRAASTGGSNARAASTGGSNALSTGGSNALSTGGSNALSTGGSNALSTGGSNALSTGGSNASAASFRGFGAVTK